MNLSIKAASSTPRWFWIVIAIVALSNIILLHWVGAKVRILFGSFLLQIIWTLGAVPLIHRCRPVLADSVLFYLCGYALGLIVFYMSGFVWLHTGLLGSAPRLAAFASIAPLLCLAVYAIFSKRYRVKPEAPLRYGVVAFLMCISFVVTAAATFGYGNNAENIKINQSEWILTPEKVPVWAHHSDRTYHYEKIIVSTYEEGFPPERLNHRGFHVSVLFVTLLTSDMTKPNVMAAYKSMAWVFFFMLSYSLFVIGRGIMGLGLRLSGFVAGAALIFSPLKIPLIALSPTYRGFFSGSGTLYHSDTQYTSTAISALGLCLVLLAFKRRARTFFLGCILISGAFFLKPSNFIILAPACYVFTVLCWEDFNRDRLAGLLVLLTVPILWFGYIYITGVSSTIDGVIGRQAHDSYKNMQVSIRPFAGYLPTLRGRFPDWIDRSSFLVILSMIVLSFAAFWIGGIRALSNFAVETTLHPKKIIKHIQKHSPVYFCLFFFFCAVILSTTLSEVNSKNINWKWSAAAAHILCIPLFVKGITLIKSGLLRSISWILFGIQLLQGVGYLGYLFWFSRLI